MTVRTLHSLRQLTYLDALADKLNFTQAAEACFVTQSTLSAGIQELERLLDVQLVERDRQRVRLTPVGEEVLARARPLLAGARDLAEWVAQAARPMTGLVRLGAIPTVAPFLLPGLLREAREALPELRIALREDRTETLLELLRAAELDFAMIALPYDTEGLLVEELFDDNLWLVEPRTDGGEDLRRGRAVEVSRIDPERLLLLEEGHCLRGHALGACGIADRPNPSGLAATSLPTLLQMVEAGLGITLLPGMAVRSNFFEASAVVARPLAPPSPPRRIALVTRASTPRRAEFEAIAGLARPLGKPARGKRA